MQPCGDYHPHVARGEIEIWRGEKTYPRPHSWEEGLRFKARSLWFQKPQAGSSDSLIHLGGWKPSSSPRAPETPHTQDMCWENVGLYRPKDPQVWLWLEASLDKSLATGPPRGTQMIHHIVSQVSFFFSFVN